VKSSKYKDTSMIPRLSLEVQNLLEIVQAFSLKKKIKLYLVGGYLRDIILKREKDNPDIDFCLKKGALNFAKALKNEIKCGFVVLDKERGCARLVKRR
jgi:tRNA nucleotidyltransferase/poly(A) polymerase